MRPGVSARAAKRCAVPKKEESLIEEMRAAIARDREHVGRRTAPLLEVPERSPELEAQPDVARRPSLLSRLLRRHG